MRGKVALKININPNFTNAHLFQVVTNGNRNLGFGVRYRQTKESSNPIFYCHYRWLTVLEFPPSDDLYDVVPNSPIT